jgi:HlyD family secretion protein
MRHHGRADIRLTLLLAVSIAAVPGCSRRPRAHEPVHARPHVRLVNPQRRRIERTTGQPGFLEAYEQTSIYPRIAGYIDEWKVDIGDRIKKGQMIAHLSVPDLEAEFEEKKAQVVLDEVRIRVAVEMANVAEHNWKEASGQLAEARANLGKYKADVERWQSEVKRLTELASERLVDAQVLAETKKQLMASTAGQKAGEATIVASQAKEAARKADLEKARVDIEAAKAGSKVTLAAQQRLAAMVGYTRILAPYDGVVVVRNANTGDYVQPAGGDRSSPQYGGAGAASSRGGGTPIFVVARTDRVRIFLDVPEMDANGVQPGSKATVRIQALDDVEIPANVTRTSWALHARTRTLRAEIDLPNKGGRLLPNMYAYGQVMVKRGNVWALPMDTIVEIGNQNCCYLYEDGKAVQTALHTGINDGKWIEVTKKRADGKWVPFKGNEQIIQADLSEISDGERVRIEKDTEGKK